VVAGNKRFRNRIKNVRQRIPCNVISLKVQILGSNLFLTPLYILLIVWVMTTYEYFPLQRYKMPPLI
jgi:hypothetical protein